MSLNCSLQLECPLVGFPLYRPDFTTSTSAFIRRLNERFHAWTHVTAAFRETPRRPSGVRPAKSISGYVLDVARKTDSDISPISPLILQGGGSKSPTFGFDIRHRSPLSRFGFETKQQIGNQKKRLKLQLLIFSV